MCLLLGTDCDFISQKTEFFSHRRQNLNLTQGQVFQYASARQVDGMTREPAWRTDVAR
jgi:hypothetical protein